MSTRRANRYLGILSLVVIVTTVGVVLVGLRAEGTRDIVQRVDSVCARAYSAEATESERDECNRILRAASLQRPLEDSCIVQRQTLKTRWYEIVTRCPPIEQSGSK